MAFNKDYLDLIFVPGGLLVMFAYHLYLLYRYLNFPQTTVMGLDNHDKKAWVVRIVQVNTHSLSLSLSLSLFLTWKP